jgi:hypothetical protein
MKIVVDIKTPSDLTEEEQEKFLTNLWIFLRKSGFSQYTRKTKQMWVQTSDVLKNYELITDENYKKLGL